MGRRVTVRKICGCGNKVCEQESAMNDSSFFYFASYFLLNILFDHTRSY
jgi:hypothetical protein